MSCIEITIAFTEDDPAGQDIANLADSSEDMINLNHNNAGLLL